MTELVAVDERGVPSMVRGVAPLPWPDLRFNALLPEPPVGHALAIASLLVEHRPVAEGLRAPRFVVRRHDGHVIAMGDDWRRLCHFRGWQLDPVLLFRHRWSWPPERQTVWHKMCLCLLERDFAAWQEQAGPDSPPFDTEPLMWVHPECGVSPPCPIAVTGLSFSRSTSTPSSTTTSRASTSRASSSSSQTMNTRTGSSARATASSKPSRGQPATIAESSKAAPLSTVNPLPPPPPKGQMGLFE